MNLFGLPSQDPDLSDPRLPSDRLAVGVREWLELIMRADIETSRKVVAMFTAYGANLDGSGAQPGRSVAAMANMSETAARSHLTALVGMGLLWIVRKAGPDSLYRLTRPSNLSQLPLWLDENMDRVPGYQRGERR